MRKSTKKLALVKKTSHTHFVNVEQQSENMSVAQYEKQIYDLQQLLEISRSLCTTIELSKLIESILYVVMAQMRVLGVGIFIKERMDDSYFSLGSNYNGLDVNIEKEYKIAVNSDFCEKAALAKTAYTLQDIEAEFGDSEEYQLLKSLSPSIIAPLILKNHVNGFLVLGERIALDADSAAYTEYEKNEIFSIASLASVAVNNATLVEQSSTDMMTKLKLKYYFFNMLTDSIDSAYLKGQPLSVMMFDIDFFKKFNDTYGHACGDYVLQSVAKIISESIREKDMACRYGGEEFTVMLPDTKKEEAMAVAERIRKAIESKDFFYENQHMQVTISIGVSQLSIEENPVTSAKDFVDQADKALYISKRNGRNRVTFADQSVINQVVE